MRMNTPLSAQIARVINQLLFLEKKSVFTYRGITLYPSELHLMEVAAADGGDNVTTMAQTLGVTKGAVSQTISRLVRKRIVTKTRDPHNKNELAVQFTATGKGAMEAFALLRADAGRRYETYLSSLTGTERKTIGTFLTQVERMIADLR